MVESKMTTTSRDKRKSRRKNHRRSSPPPDDADVSARAATTTADDEERPAPPVVAASSSAGEDNACGGGGPLHYCPYEEIVPAPILHDDAGVVTPPPPDGGDAAAARFSEDGLAVATAVTDAGAYDEYIYSAIEYDPDSKPPLHRNRRFRTYSCVALLVVAAAASTIAVYVTRGAKGPEIIEEEVLFGGFPSKSPSASPTSDRMASGVREQIEAGVLSRGATFGNVTDPGDPRRAALDWILHDDPHQLESDDANLYQRYVLALLAYAFDSVAWYDCGDHRRVTNATIVDYGVEDCDVQDAGTGQVVEKKVWLSGSDECEWYGVICSEDGVVRGLELIGNGLIGDIPPEISQLRFLQYLALNGNCLYGTIPPEFGSMSNLLSLELHGNGLSGELPPEMFDADKLQLLNVALQYGYPSECVMSNGTVVKTYFQRGGTMGARVNYGLEGNVLGPDVSRWSSMKGLHLFDNSFGGDINETIGDLKYLVFLRAQNNLFYGYIPAGVSRLKKLRELFLNTNELYSDLPPDIGDMEDLESLKVGDNEMFGPIPDSLYGLVKLKQLWLQDTVHCVEVEGGVGEYNCMVDMDYGFEGSIRTEIGNLTKLEMLVLNNNPLTGTIPTEIGTCEDLAVLHIHKTYIEGSAPRELCLLRDKKLNSETGNGVFYADCRPNNGTGDPFFSCDCCSDCCDHTSQVCIADD